MVDPISTGASAVTIVDRIVAFAAWVRRAGKPRNAAHLLQPSNRGLEVWPVNYLITLDGPVPTIELTLRAINYLPRSLELRELKVARFAAGGLPAIDSIPLSREAILEPRSSLNVFCSRPLADSEARAIADVGPWLSPTGSVSFTARGVVRRKEVRYTPGVLMIEGSIRRAV